MTTRTSMLKQETIETVVAMAQARLSGGKAETAARFVRHYYENVAPEDIVGADPEDLFGAALSLWQFGAQRRPGETKIRIFNPRAGKQGWQSAHTVVEIVNDDMPFLVDSATLALNRGDLTVHLVVHPQFAVTRDDEGNAVALRPRGEAAAVAAAVAESYMHIEIDERGAPDLLRAIEQDLAATLADVRRVVAGWRPMIDAVSALTDELKSAPPASVATDEVAETIAFLDWLLAGNFTLLGYREMDVEGEGRKARVRMREESGIGLLADPNVVVFQGLRHLGQLPAKVQDYLWRPHILVMTKTSWRSTVHRPVQLDAIAVKRFDAAGRVVDVRLFVGLFTSSAYNQSPAEIPMLRRKVAALMRRSGYDPNSHAGKALLHVLHGYPRDELFQIDEDDLFEIARGIVQLQERQRIALFLRRDPFERFISAFVYVPRERYTTKLRMDFEQILSQAFNGEIAGRYTRMTDDVLSRLHFIVGTRPGEIPDYDPKEVEARLVEAGRSWGDRLKEALIAAKGEEIGLASFARYSNAFPVGYTEEFSAQAAVHDIGCIDRALADGELGMNLYRPIGAEANEFRFKIYNPGHPVPLSDVLPMLENMGLKVLGEVPHTVHAGGADKTVWMHDFSLMTMDGRAIDQDAVRDAFHKSFARIWRGEMENDGFNRLVLFAGIGWREVVVLRACCKYLRQAAIPFSQAYMEQTLANNGGIALELAALFETRFDPDSAGDREAAERSLVADIQRDLDSVENLDEDRILRRFLNVIQATLRTNFYQREADGTPKSRLVFKFDAGAIDGLPQPRPWREIFVYSPRTEGVHLRFGPVSRGGLRWSDRREDFRTEILGLVKAQQVKNAVIVPVGSKGGFVLKRPPAPGDREATQAEGIACYRIFISGLLDITDNRVGDAIVPPDRVLRKDGDDPYLVVAADKGTATFSDIANGIARDYGFWLDDAFASGGSAGYDHKKMGITARGAWESVKRHFREMGRDTQAEDFTAIGVGDMSGDVFGNGMLLSPHIRLIGAFNHMHVFFDPDPDPRASLKERKRLFDLPRSSWADYNAKLISKGGGIFERRAKSIPVSPEMAARFAIAGDRVTPSDLIRAMLRAEIDLLWFGGIGTYVKATRETDADAGDRANDALRVDARELRCKVVAEGANLAVTQRGRVEFALGGGRINTDAIDNSAGVDTSDHEVNIKILLGDLVARRKLSIKQRDKLLVEMTDEVAELVLRDNYQQTQSISVVESQGGERLDEQQRLIRTLERTGRLNRRLEFLPDDEALAERQAGGRGLTRPELSVLLAYAKIVTFDALLASDLPDDPLLADDLVRYFPAPLQEKYGDTIARHRLRREIVATGLTNSLINRTGPAFINEMKIKTGMDVPEIARAYTAAREVFGLRQLWQDIEALDNAAPAEAQTHMLLETVRTVWRAAPWFLRHCPHPMDIAATVAEFHDGVRRIADRLDTILAADQKQDLADRASRYAKPGVPADLALRVGRLKVLSAAPDIVRIASDRGQGVEDTGAAYFAVGDRFRLDWLRQAAGTIPANNHWHRMAMAAVVEDMWGHQNDLTSAALSAGGTGAAAVAAWTAARADAMDGLDQLMAEITAAPAPDLAMLAVVNRQLRALAGM